MPSESTCTTLIPLWLRNEIVAHAIVDISDLDLVVSHRWRLLTATPLHRYAMRQVGNSHHGGRSVLFMHRVILGLQPGHVPEVDHINHDTLDNRRSNLSAGSHAVNMQNRPGSRVCWDKERHIWRARIRRDNQRIEIGRFVNREDAISAVGEWIEQHPIVRAA